MTAIKLTLPWPPTLNHYRQPVCRGKRARLITSTDGRDYKVRAFTAIVEQGRPRIAGPVRISERVERDIANKQAGLAEMRQANQRTPSIESLTRFWENDRVREGGAPLAILGPGGEFVREVRP